MLTRSREMIEYVQVSEGGTTMRYHIFPQFRTHEFHVHL